MTSSPWNLVLIFIGGGLGASCRWLLDNTIARFVRTDLWPVGILTVNMLGCLLIGLLFGALIREKETASWIWPFAATGFLGGFTTFSTFALQLLEQYLAKQWGVSLAYACGSVVLGFLLVLGGYMLGRNLQI